MFLSYSIEVLSSFLAPLLTRIHGHGGANVVLGGSDQQFFTKFCSGSLFGGLGMHIKAGLKACAAGGVADSLDSSIQVALSGFIKGSSCPLEAIDRGPETLVASPPPEEWSRGHQHEGADPHYGGTTDQLQTRNTINGTKSSKRKGGDDAFTGPTKRRRYRTDKEIVRLLRKEFGKERIKLLLDRRSTDVQITADMVMAVAVNSERGKELMTLLLNRSIADVPITEEIVRLIAKKFGKEVMLLLDRRNIDIQVTADVVTAAAGNIGTETARDARNGGHATSCPTVAHPPPENSQQLLNSPYPNNNKQALDPSGQKPLGLNLSAADVLLSRLHGMEEAISALKTEILTQKLSSAEPEVTGCEMQANYNRLSSGVQDYFPGNQDAASPARSSGRHVVEDSTGATIYLGSNSEPALLLGCRQGLDCGAMEWDSLGQLAATTYPFANVWGGDVRISDVLHTLPTHSDTMRYWQLYRHSAYPFYPVLMRPEQFEIDLLSFFEKMQSAEQPIDSIQGRQMSWLALLFAVLACGAQFSNDSGKDRDLRSKVFGTPSHSCLRAANFFYTADTDQIQALLLLGNCIRNNTNTNAAWILMGTTIRLAQSIGLHDTSASQGSPSSTSSLDAYQKSKLWWMAVWQDTHLSFSYGRPQSLVTSSIPYESSQGSERSFVDSILSLCQVILDRAQSSNAIGGKIDFSIEVTLSYKDRLEGIFRDASPFLTDKSHSRTLQDHLERLALNIHVGYTICRICRLCLERTPSTSSQYLQLLIYCNERAALVVKSFLELHRLSDNVCRSWGFVQNAVSCAAILCMSSAPADARPPVPNALIEGLIMALENDEKESQWRDDDTNLRTSGPYSRALVALRRVYAVEGTDEVNELDEMVEPFKSAIARFLIGLAHDSILIRLNAQMHEADIVVKL
ncbi:hypothetical protein V500_02296 [Pseudogymnoascus sp. VKM F-4518 (FW-2643)]|nr:hypothetical protein V500_02296 [Pseudogymnoascus sp. VKM F-4518 (FW-2643)]